MNNKRPSRLLLSDWGAYGDVYSSAEEFISEVIILSLMYDEILIQDEIFTLNSSMPNWFSGKYGHNLLSKFMNLESIVFLGWNSFPENIDIDPSISPFRARAQFLQDYSTNGDSIFVPNNTQKKFYQDIDSLYTQHPNRLRPRSTLKEVDPYVLFKKIFCEILLNGSYNEWLKNTHPFITDNIKEDLLNFALNPEKGLALLKDMKFTVKNVEKNGAVIFNRSLGFQLSKLYKQEAKSDIQELIQSCFAIPLCHSENAVGKFSKRLREIPLSIKDERIITNIMDKPVLEFDSETVFNIPNLVDDFPTIINKVRNSTAGIELREVLREQTNVIPHWLLQDKWKAVANELAYECHIGTPINFLTRALSVGGSVVTSTAVSQLTSSASNLHDNLLISSLSTGLGIISEEIVRLVYQRLKTHKTRKEIESLTNFRCSWMPVDYNQLNNN